MMTLVYEETARPAAAPRVHENSARVLVPQTLVQTRRILIKWSRDVTAIIMVTVLPVLFLITMNIVLGHAVTQVAGYDALFNTVPMNVLAAAVNGSAVGAIGLIVERDEGLLRRLWVVPVHRASGVCSRILAEMVRIVVTTGIVLVAGMVLGFRFKQGILPTLVWLSIPVLFGLAFATLIISIAWYASKNFLLEAITLVHLLAILFSTGFLPVDQFPKWIQPVVAHQPISCAIDTMRALALGGPVRSPMVQTLLWVAGITAVCVAPTLLGYRRASTRR
ncbi:daunorubicin-DIM-transport integral membrane protein ABC transporter DrrC [Mycobacterium lentiflavum]|uniref:Transport permease protein n=1 Tax=Mycobacterium lentiflavum TaxID=141349 RepID=A0A0E4CMN0_MYCLN|nr:ABC transporter permease [Mycobacterium lentiflavum]CQD10482.1 daunorubicin-DIM-transport integral membrane protein ABC transporter DrrC [Mycobacterium lentiflavum]